MATVRTLIGYVKGQKGDTGATGATGPRGPAGQDGAPGVSDYATTEAAGLVRVGDDFKINSSNGTLSIKNLFTTASTLAKMVSEEAFAISLGKIAKAVDWVVDNAPNFFNKNTDIVDGFDSALTDKALSANAGKTLKTLLDSLNGSITPSEIAITSAHTVNSMKLYKIGRLCVMTGSFKPNSDIEAWSGIVGTISNSSAFPLTVNAIVTVEHGVDPSDTYFEVIPSNGVIQTSKKLLTGTTYKIHGCWVSRS